MNINTLDHIVLTTAHLEECLHFYVDILGMKLLEKDGRYALGFGNQKINIHRRKGEFLPAAAHVTCGSLDFCLITTDDIESVKKELLENGIVPEEGIVKRTGALGPIDSIYLRDPDGNLVEIAAYQSSLDISLPAAPMPDQSIGPHGLP